jgi:hypothetical protein
MTYWQALHNFTIEFKGLSEIKYSEPNLVFLGTSFLVGLIVIILDIINFYFKDKSFLDMKYNKQTKYWLVIICWSIASTFVSYLGLIMQIFNSTIQSCVIVGFSWIYLAAKIANKRAEPKIEQE